MAEEIRLGESASRTKNWQRWGPYLSERQWGTVREDYSEDGNAWDSFTHDESRSRTYRWGEDGLMGITDRECRLCFGVALWNGKDSILKERLFGLSGNEGNHGEDCKELYYYLDSTPTHSYMKMLYKYPQNEYPYKQLVEANTARSREEMEYEIEDTGLFDNAEYFDVITEYAKGEPNDILIRITVSNHGPEEATCHVVPQIWFRNTWETRETKEEDIGNVKPTIEIDEHNSARSGFIVLTADHQTLGSFMLQAEPNGNGVNDALFTDNVTNKHKIFDVPLEEAPKYSKDAFHRYIVDNDHDAVNPEQHGTKAGIHYNLRIGAGKSEVIKIRLFAPGEAEMKENFSAADSHEGHNHTDTRDHAAYERSTKVFRMSSDDHTFGDNEGVHRNAKNSLQLLLSKYHDACRSPSGSPVRRRKEVTTADNDDDDNDDVDDDADANAHAEDMNWLLDHSLVHFGDWFGEMFRERIKEANVFYKKRLPLMVPAQRLVARQAYAGMLMSKQFFFYVVKDWLEGDAGIPSPPAARKKGRNCRWTHLHNREIISMPDKWEYPWYASWDLAFHMIPFARIDAQFAKDQLILFLREWYMSPAGQIPAYEWAFEDVNPPVHAWSVFRVHKITQDQENAKPDYEFLVECFQKLLINFTWWVNRKDPNGENLFSGGFLGLDNIGIFDRSKPLPTGGRLAQADGTSWMAFYCVGMLDIALELNTAGLFGGGIASKFFEHFLDIVDAMNCSYGESLWDEEDGFYYDMLIDEKGQGHRIKVRSMVGLIPLYACTVMDPADLAKSPKFVKRMNWFVENRPGVASLITTSTAMHGSESNQTRYLLAIVNREKLVRMLKYLFDEEEFFGPFGIRSLSKFHEKNPDIDLGEHGTFNVKYAPGESATELFGGNSNWRGPVWFPVNYLIIESLEKYHEFYGNSLKVEVPTGSGNMLNLKQAANAIAERMSKIFLPDENGARPCHFGNELYTKHESWKKLPLFYEYFDPETGRGVGASHQTGWTGLVTECLDRKSSAISTRVSLATPAELVHTPPTTTTATPTTTTTSTTTTTAAKDGDGDGDKRADDIAMFKHQVDAMDEKLNQVLALLRNADAK